MLLKAINLLPRETVNKIVFKQNLRRAATVVVVASLFWILFAGFFCITKFVTERLAEQVAVLTADAQFVEAEQTAAELRRRRTEWEKVESLRSGSVAQNIEVVYLDVLYENMGGFLIRGITLDSAERKIVLQLESRGTDTMSDFVDRLEATEMFEQIDIAELTVEAQKMSFTINVFLGD